MSNFEQVIAWRLDRLLGSGTKSDPKHWRPYKLAPMPCRGLSYTCSGRSDAARTLQQNRERTVEAPAAIGVALVQRDQGSNRKVICIVGDGADQYVIQGLWTAAQLKLPILFIVMRNVEYAILKSFAEQQETPRIPGLNLPGIDSVKLAEGYGCSGYRVTDPGALAEALKDGLAKGGPYLIEIGIDPKVPPLI